MAETLVLSEAEAIELFSFLVSSARTQLDEPCRYASMRVLTAAEILRDFVMERVSPDAQTLLEGTVNTITHAHVYMADTEVYTTALDDLCREVADYVVNQSGLSKGAA
jgi:hypothetical protein